MKNLLLLIFSLFVLTACSDDEQAPELPAPTVTATAVITDIPPMSVEVRLDAEVKYEQLRQLHTEIGEVWENLASGETAQCGTAFTILAPETILGVDPVMASLRQAAIELESAVLLWEAECQNPRPQPPSEVIDQGVLMVRAAGDALSAAENRLTETP